MPYGEKVNYTLKDINDKHLEIQQELKKKEMITVESGGPVGPIRRPYLKKDGVVGECGGPELKVNSELAMQLIKKDLDNTISQLYDKK